MFPRDRKPRRSALVALAGGLAAAGALMVASPPVQALAGTSALRGRVTNIAGAVVAGAAVAIIRSDGRVRVVVSDAGGHYEAAGLRPGHYTVWAYTHGYGLYDNPRVRVRGPSGDVLDIRLPDETGTSPRVKPGSKLEASGAPGSPTGARSE